MEQILTILGLAIIVVPIIEMSVDARRVSRELATLESELALPKNHYELAEISSRLMTISRSAKWPSHKRRIARLLKEVNTIMK